MSEKIIEKVRFKLKGMILPTADAEVWLNGKQLDLNKSLEVRNHSPTGFSWGYPGSGPSQLALAICMELYGDAGKMPAFYQNFKWVVIARLPQGSFDCEIEYDPLPPLSGEYISGLKILSIKPYPIDTIVRLKKTGELARIKAVDYLKDGMNFLNYRGEIEGRAEGLWALYHDDIELEALPNVLNYNHDDI